MRIFVYRLLITLIALLLSGIAHAEPVIPHGTAAQRGQAALGMVAFTVIAFVIGRLRGAKTIPWRVIIWGTILSFIFGAMVIYQPRVLITVQELINKLLDYSNEGAHMVFGNLIKNPVEVTRDAT